MSQSVAMRQEVERKIARAFIRSALKAGYSISVFDCEEFTLRRSTDEKAILGAMFTTDDDRLYVHIRGSKIDSEWERDPHKITSYFGWVWFVYGNSGWDVISDYTTNLEPLMADANKVSDRYCK